jgi:hypothetical protein
MVIKIVDRALKRLYNIDPKFKAENFLLQTEDSEVEESDGDTNSFSVPSGRMHAALLVRADLGNTNDFSLAIYLSHALREKLKSISHWDVGSWDHQQVSAFVTLTEEISHFNYLLFHSLRGRKVSQLELELQADVDKFLIVFFATIKGREVTGAFFERLYDQLFLHFRLRDELTPQQRERYENANAVAKSFVLKFRPLLKKKNLYEKALQLARKFYRVDCPEKISLARR